MKEIYDMVTNAVIKSLESGNIPWQADWINGMPKNILGYPYRGINTFMLLNPLYKSNLWGTFNQYKAKGHFVKKGEKGTPIIFWKTFPTKEVKENGQPKMGFVLRYSTVFNIEQTDMPVPEIQTIDPMTSIANAEEVLQTYKAKLGSYIEEGASAAYYPMTDHVQMPPRESFKSAEGFYLVAFHELGHSTGHKSRLNRQGITEHNGFGSHEYSFEELVAEMTSAMVGGSLALTKPTEDDRHIANAAAYIKGWLKALKNDNTLLAKAAGQAQKAADLILGVKVEEKEEE